MSSQSQINQGTERDATPSHGINEDDEDIVLQISDVSLDGQSTELLMKSNNDLDLGTALTNLPPLKNSTARIFECFQFEPRQQTSISSTEGQSIAENILMPYIISKCTTNAVPPPPPPPRFPDPEEISSHNFKEIASQWDDMEVGVSKNWISNTIGLQRNLRYHSTIYDYAVSICLAFKNDQILVLIIHVLHNDQRKYSGLRNYDYFRGSSFTKAIIKNRSWLRYADGTHTNFLKLFVLEFLESNILIRRFDGTIPLAISHSSPGALAAFGGKPWLNMEDNSKYLLLNNSCERIMAEIFDLQETINFLLDSILKIWNPTTSKSAAPNDKQIDMERVFELRERCRKRLNNVQRVIEAVNRVFEAQNKVLNIQESISVKRLTILASIYLPLSLSTSLLSMQTRFIHLNLLLYDFLGVFTIIGSATLLLFVVVRAILTLKSSYSRVMWSPIAAWKARHVPEKYASTEISFMLYSFNLYFFYLSLWLVFLVSFLVGMLYRVKLGAKILGFGLAGILAYLISGFLIVLILPGKRWRMLIRPLRQKVESPFLNALLDRLNSKAR